MGSTEHEADLERLFPATPEWSVGVLTIPIDQSRGVLRRTPIVQDESWRKKLVLD
jgi:hypothetical protein